MPEEIKLIQPVTVERDQDGYWDHPELPDFDEDIEAFKAWLVAQGLELKQWSMEADLTDHPYWDMGCDDYGCVGWNPEAPGPEWFLLSIFDTEDGPYVNWVRREVKP